MKRFNFFYFIGLFFAVSFASAQAPSNVTIQGRVFKPDGTFLSAPSVVFTLKVISPGAEGCVLYEETQTVTNLSTTQGSFSLPIGSGVRGGSDPGLSLATLFKNSGTMTGLICVSGTTYSPVASQSRKVRVSFDDGSGTGPQALASDYSLSSSVFAFYADDALKLNGIAANKYFSLAGTSNFTPLSNAEYTKFQDLIAGTSAQYLSTSASTLTAATVTGSVVSSGDLTIDSTTHATKGNILMATAGGKVGIGTTTPSRLLDVAGDVLINGILVGRGLGNSLSNTVIGDVSTTFVNNTSGYSNTAMGYQSMQSNTTGYYNTGLGRATLNANQFGIDNTAVGTSALQTTSSDRSTAVGFRALMVATSGAYNVALGAFAGSSVTTGAQNTAIGSSAQAGTTGSTNTTLGYNSGSALTTGSNNVIVGSNTGASIATLSNNILLSDGAGAERLRIDNAGNVGIGTTNPTALEPNSKFTVAGSSAGTGIYTTVIDEAGNQAGMTLYNRNSGAVTARSVISQISNDRLVFDVATTGGLTEAITIKNSTGNVGIGTTAPSALLDVNGSSRFRGNRQSLYSGGSPPNYSASMREKTIELRSEFAPTAGGTNIAIAAARPMGTFDVDIYFTGDLNGTGSPFGLMNLKFETMLSNGGPLYLSNARVTLKRWTTGTFYSIGGTPNVAVSLSGSNIILTVAGGETSYNTGYAVVKFNGNNFDDPGVTGISLPGGAAASTSWVAYTGYDTDSSNNFVVSTNNSERMRVDANGNVGIGTTTPTSALSVSGDGTFTGKVGIGATPPAAPLYIYSGSGVLTPHFGIGQAAGARGLFFGAPISASGVTAYINITNGGVGTRYLDFRGEGVSRMVMTASGNIGIGTTTPQVALDIVGVVRSSKYAVQPFACDAAHDASLALNSAYRHCVCNGGTTTWVYTSDGVTSCVW